MGRRNRSIFAAEANLGRSPRHGLCRCCLATGEKRFRRDGAHARDERGRASLTSVEPLEAAVDAGLITLVDTGAVIVGSDP
jgi:hypothetical protein